MCLINSKTFEHADLIFTEPWTLTNEIMLNIIQSFKFDFSRKRILGRLGWTFYVPFQEPYLIFPRFFLIYRGILELKNNTSIWRKNSSFAHKTCCDLTTLFVKQKFSFCRCNFANK